jgi:hypothetical protein
LDEIDIIAIINDFTARNVRRKFYGKFKYVYNYFIKILLVDTCS